MDNNLYTQIGLVLLVGLSAKNAILIVEFARHGRAEGKSIQQAAVEGAKLRFRPIVMTSLAFGFGVLPLAIASGAGAGAMKAIGTSVAGGMLSATCIDLFYIPLFFVFVSRIFKGKQSGGTPGTGSEAVSSPGPEKIG
jgi:multidrug efflux pump